MKGRAKAKQKPSKGQAKASPFFKRNKQKVYGHSLADSRRISRLIHAWSRTEKAFSVLFSFSNRMTIGEDKDKVRKIVDGSIMELRDLYRAQLKKMSDVSNPYTYLHAPSLNSVNAPADVMYEQDMSPGARHYHLTMLPKNMQESLVKVRKQALLV